MINHPEARNTNWILNFLEDKDMSLAVQKANISDITLGVTPFSTGKKELKLPSNKIEHSQVAVSFISSETFREWLFIYKWILRLKNTPSNKAYQYKTIELIMLNSQNLPTVKFIYGGTFPISLGGSELAYDEDGSSVIVNTAVFEYNTLDVIDIDGNEIPEEYYTDE